MICFRPYNNVAEDRPADPGNAVGGRLPGRGAVVSGVQTSGGVLQTVHVHLAAVHQTQRHSGHDRGAAGSRSGLHVFDLPAPSVPQNTTCLQNDRLVSSLSSNPCSNGMFQVYGTNELQWKEIVF